MFGLQLAKSTPVFNRPELLVTSPQKGINRNGHCSGWDRFEPATLAWQWSVKDSPDIQSCSPNTLKSKQCPKKRFFPRFKKVIVHKDITSCEEPKTVKPMTWKEYFSFLLPDEMTKKPPMVMCRRMYEMRKKRCEENWKKCGSSLPTEWYGQGVLHNVALSLPVTNDLPMVRFCPPPEHMKPRCAVAKLTERTETSSPCLEHYDYKVPFSNFKGGPNPPSAKQYIIKCNLKCLSEPSVHEKSAKLNCKTYGEFKGVECPKNMFTRFMNVDLPGGTLRPVIVSDYKPQREIKKGVCMRTTLTQPRSIRNYHTTKIYYNDKKDSAKILTPKSVYLNNPEDTQHLQPSSSALCVDSLAKRAGVDLTLNRPKNYAQKKKAPSNNVLLQKLYREDKDPKEETDKLPAVALPAKKEKVKLIPKTPLQRLILIHNDKKKKLREESACVKTINAKASQSIEYVPYPVRKYHSKPKIININQKYKKSPSPKRNIFKANYHTTPKYRSVLLSKKKKEDDCEDIPDVKKEDVKEVKEEIKKVETCVAPKKKVSVHDIPRETCYPSIPKKEGHKGVICSIARIFNIGCGKKCN